MGKKLLLIDANSLIHRSYHAIPGLQNSKGEATGALFGLSNTLQKILAEEKPDFVAAAFDRPERTFRKELDESYKAHRPKAPDDLIEQIIRAREVFGAFNIAYFEAPGFEADDIIGTLAERFGKEMGVTILTGDLDSLQLVKDGHIRVVTFKKGVSETIIYDERGVFERFHVRPDQIVDYKALVGDASDNISGVPGIGAKSAEKLLNEYGTLEKILEAKNPNKLGGRVQEYKNEALLSKKLATINRSVPLDVSLEKITWKGQQEEKLLELFEKLEFQTLVRRIDMRKKPQEKPEKEQKEGGKNIKKSSGKKVAFSWKEALKKTIKNGWATDIDASFFDISIAAWLIEPDKKIENLESLCTRLLEENPKNEEEQLESLASFLERKIKERGLENIYKNFEIPLIPALAEMEWIGIQINRKKLFDIQKEIEEEIKKTEEKIWGVLGKKINLNSPHELSRALFDDLGIVPEKQKKTKTGLRSTREDVLKELEEKNPVISLILQYRENTKILTTYVRPIIECADKNGVVRTTFIQTGTATGRLASEKPNLQNLPQESKWSKVFRSAFEAREGYSFLSLDYSQLELRIIAHISKDENLIKTFQEGGDVHTATAQKIFQRKEITQKERRLAKTLNFGLAYGMGPRLFSKESGVSLIEAKKYIEQYFAEFPEIKVWQEKEKTEVKKRGVVENENGRKRWFYGIKNPSEIERAAINMPIQSLGADIMKLAIIQTREYLKKFTGKDRPKMILTIHDELILEVPDDILEETAPRFSEIAENCFRLSVPLLVEAKRGKTLGELKKTINERLL